MYDISELEITGKGIAIAVLVGVVLLVGIFCAGYMFGIQQVHDNGNGTQPISNELGQVGTNISNANQGISNAENHAGNIEAGIENAQESVEYLQGTANTSADIIRQSKSIVEAIRKRGKTDKVTN